MTQRYAFLVAAHTDAVQLCRLMDALLPMGDVYLHIDRKTRDKTFLATVEDYAHHHCTAVTLVRRISVAWAGWSQCRAQRIMLGAALASHRSYSRYFFLSGLCYPVLSAYEMSRFLASAGEREYVAGYNISRCGVRHQLYKIRFYHLFRDIPLPHRSLLRRTVIVGTRTVLRLIGFRKKPWLTVDGRREDVFFGGQWTGLTDACARYVFQRMAKGSPYARYFATAYAPDELLIPTIVHNSPFASSAISVCRLDFSALSPLHYLHYGLQIEVWDEAAYDDIIASGRPFVRKITTGKSDTLVRMLEQRKHTAESAAAETTAVHVIQT